MSLLQRIDIDGAHQLEAATRDELLHHRQPDRPEADLQHTYFHGAKSSAAIVADGGGRSKRGRVRDACSHSLVKDVRPGLFCAKARSVSDLIEARKRLVHPS
jgi:hypothetical protein